MPIIVTNVRTLPSTDFGCGGLPFAYQPPQPGLALIGLAIRAGQWIDQVTPIFAELLEDGTLGPEIHGPSYGGPGGSPDELRVAPGHVVTGIQSRSGHFIDAVRLLQARFDSAGVDTSGHEWTRWMGGPNTGGAERIERFVEPYGVAVAIGIAGHAGRYVDNLTLITGEVTRVPGTAMAKGATKTARASTAAG